MTRTEDAKNNISENSAKSPKGEEDIFEVFADLKEEDMIRGESLQNVEARCLDLCKTYIGGAWNKANLEDIEVKRVSGGFTNQLYKVALKESVPIGTEKSEDDEPRQVAIKFYQAKHMNNYNADDAERLNDIIILSILSEVGIGPKVYGIFNDGFIQAFHEHEQFRHKHQQDPALQRELATTLATIHHLNVPIHKANDLMLKDLQKGIEFAYSELGILDLVYELQLPTFLKKDLRDEYRDMLRYVEQVNCPTVFCHHDFRGGNILVTEPDKKLCIVDLEYSGYGPRGYDLGTLFTDWGKKDFFEQFVYVVPPDEDFRKMAKLYIEACEKLNPGYSKKPENSIEQIVREAKFFYLVQNMFFVAVMIKQKEGLIPAMQFDIRSNLKSVEYMYNQYHKVKEALIADGTIQRLN